MPDTTAQTLLALVGTRVEFAACLLLTALVFGLRRQVRSHEYFRLWTWAWIALTIAIGAVTLRYDIVPLVAAPVIEGERSPLVTVLYAIYQVFKLGFLGCLGLGVFALAADRPLPKRVIAGVLGAAVIAGLVSVALTQNLNRLVLIQTTIAVPVFAVSVWRLGTGPSADRGVGHAVLRGILTVLAVQWALYFRSFLGALSGEELNGWVTPLRLLSAYNSYFDTGALLVLGIGMVLTVVEHDHRDADRAQGARVRDATASGQRLSEVLRAAHEGIVTLDPARQIEAINPAAMEILDVEWPAVRGRDFDQFLRPAERSAFWSRLATQTHRSEAHSSVALRSELVGIRANGAEFPMELALSSFGEGADRGYVVVLRDLTTQIQAREEQERLQQQLAHTARLEAIGRMVSGVAHELNNPLTAILAFSQDLHMNAKSDDDREALAVVMQQAQRCRVIVGDLLIFARSRREEQRQVTPDELVKRVGRVFERDATRNGLTFAVTIHDDLPPIEVDVTGIEQVLANLLTNALQATPAGGQITLTAAPRGDRVEFVVDDTGPGIPAEVMPRLFEPFFTTKEPGVGTGLGLSVSHAIVQQHGGTLHAENRAGKGSGARFILRLPFVDRRRERADVAVGSRPGEAPVARVRRLLVVDDEAAIRAAVRRSLERRGWEVEEAADGAEALLKLEGGGRSAGFDAIVTDLRMPGMSGIELYRRLEAASPALAARTLVITGDTASPTVAEFLAELSVPYLQKPFEMRALAERLDQVTAAAAGPVT